MIEKQTKKLNKKQPKKLKISALQKIVNEAIRKRDGDCKIRDGKRQCNGVLTASHYFSVGGNSTWRFYPPNIHAQCFGHHGIHERGQEPFFYRRWMQENEPDALEFMELHWSASIKYTQVVLKEILEFARAGNLEGLREYIETLILQE